MTAPLPARLLRRARAAERLVRLALTPPAGAMPHALPGQYVLASAGGGPGAPFALASRPGADEWELLVREGSPAGDALASLPEGAELSVSAPQGGGFPLEGTDRRDLLLLAAGSGISAVRALLLYVLERRNGYGRVVLVQGARTPDELAYLEEVSAWRAQGVEVVHCVSRPADTGWDGAVGHVQGQLDGRVTAATVAFLCGPPELVRQAGELLRGRGVGGADVRLNF